MGPKKFIQLFRELLTTSNSPVDKLIAKGDAALTDGQPVIAAIHFTDAYGILARTKDKSILPIQLVIAQKLVEAYTQQGETGDVLYWKETIIELQREMK